MGIHTGTAEWNGKDYMGYITLARTQRIMSAAYGDQIIISGDTYELTKEKYTTILHSKILGKRRLRISFIRCEFIRLLPHVYVMIFRSWRHWIQDQIIFPYSWKSFIGREEEMRKIKGVLRQTSYNTWFRRFRKKTRLALQVAADIMMNLKTVCGTLSLHLCWSCPLPQAINRYWI